MEFLRRPLILQWHPRKRRIAVARLKSKWKYIVNLLKQRMLQCLRIVQKCPPLFNKAIKFHAQFWSRHIISPETWVLNGARWYSWWLHFFEIGYCGHPAFPYANIQLEKSTKLILSHFQKEDHPFIYDTLNNKNTPLVCLYFFTDLRRTHLERI